MGVPETALEHFMGLGLGPVDVRRVVTHYFPVARCWVLMFGAEDEIASICDMWFFLISIMF